MPSVKLGKLDLSMMEENAVFVCHICGKFFARPYSLTQHRKTCAYRKRLQLEKQNQETQQNQQQPQIQQKQRNHFVRKVVDAKNSVFYDQFNIQHRVMFEGDRKFFCCGRCDRRFCRRDRLFRHSQSHVRLQLQRPKPIKGACARKSTMYKQEYVGPSGSWPHRSSSVAQNTEIKIQENEVILRVALAS